MRGRLWIDFFIKSLVELEDKSEVESDSEWTEFMKKVMQKVGDKLNCYPVMRRPEPKEDEYSGEYLSIDVIYVDNAEYDSSESRSGMLDPFVLPRAVVELHNDFSVDDISYCLWKILCVRAPVRVLICYQSSEQKVGELRELLERVIWQGKLMKGTAEDLLIIIGNEEAKDENWEEYFTILEWRSDRLEGIEGIEW